MIEKPSHNLLSEFAGLPVYEFSFPSIEKAARGGVPRDVEAWAWRIALTRADHDIEFKQVFAVFLETVDTTRVRALILGNWLFGYDPQVGSHAATDPLLEHAARFPALDALFVGDMASHQAEISWIQQADPGPLFTAFPGIRSFGLRGTTELTMDPFKHAALEELAFQGGGLSPEVVHAICASELPSLTVLDLYLGTPEYNGGATPEDLAPILGGQAFPGLQHLGLRDAENQDEIAAALAHAPVVAQLETLDLSLGILSDEGAAALLAGQPLTHLTSLDLHYHYLSEEMMQRLREALPGVEVRVDEQMEPDLWDGESNRYIAVSE